MNRQWRFKAPTFANPVRRSRGSAPNKGEPIIMECSSSRTGRGDFQHGRSLTLFACHDARRRTRLKKVLFLLLTVLLLTWCAMGPDYQRPAVSVPENFRVMSDTEMTSLANLPWWQLLRDEQLQQLIRTAMVENKDLKRVMATVEEFQARLMVSKMDFAPGFIASTNAPVLGRQTVFTFPGFPNPFAYY